MRLAVLMVILAVLCACGESSTSASAPASPSATPVNEEIQKNPGDILADLDAVILHQKAYHIELEGTDTEGAITASLDVNSAGQMRGTIIQNGASSAVVVVGDIMYIEQPNTTGAIIGSPPPQTPRGAWFEVRLNFIPILVTLQKASSLEKCVNDLGTLSVDEHDYVKSKGLQLLPLILKPNDSDRAEVYMRLQPSLQLVQITMDAITIPPPSCAGGLSLTPNDYGAPIGYLGDIVFGAYTGGVAGTSVTPPPSVVSPFRS